LRVGTDTSERHGVRRTHELAAVREAVLNDLEIEVSGEGWFRPIVARDVERGRAAGGLGADPPSGTAKATREALVTPTRP
jgi:hypothetical protein